jgi:hypothetical protein
MATQRNFDRAAGLGRLASRVFPAVPAIALASCGLSGSAVDGPVMRYPGSSYSGGQMDAEVRGVLELEGACLYVDLDEVGERYPVLWPSGTRWDGDSQAVVTPEGEALSMGEEVYGSGGYLKIADVESRAGADAADLARQCIDNTYGDVAVVNNSESAIGRGGP